MVCFDNFGELAAQRKLQQCECEEETQIDELLFSDDDEESENIQKMDTGVTTEDNFNHSPQNPLPMSEEALDEYLFSADSLRSCFSKQFNLGEIDPEYSRNNSAK